MTGRLRPGKIFFYLCECYREILSVHIKYRSLIGGNSLKKISLTLLGLIVILSACSSRTTTAIEPTAAHTATNPPIPTDTAVIVSPTTTSEALISQGVPTSGCTVESPFPTPGPTQQSIFPAVSDDDWKYGPSDAYVTILEYGDFQ